MSALAAAAWADRPQPGATVHVRVTDSTQAADFIGYLDRLGLRAVARPDGSITIRLWDDVGLAEARLEIAMAIGTWVQRHGVPVQLS